MSDKTTVFQAGGQSYAVQCRPEEVMRIATGEFVKLIDGNEAIYLRGNAITQISSWELPTHHGRIWALRSVKQQDKTNTK